MRRSAYLLPALTMLFVACTTTSAGVDASVPPSPSEDDAYAPIVEKWRRQSSVVEQFNKKVEVSAVLFTDEFRRAYRERFQRMRGEAHSQIDDGLANRIVVLVSIFAPERAYESLDDRRFWTLSLEYGATTLGNPEFRRVNEKSVVEPFFSFVNPWTHEYLVAFDPEAEGGSQTLPQSVTLVMRSAIATVRIPWRSSSGNP